MSLAMTECRGYLKGDVSHLWLDFLIFSAFRARPSQTCLLARTALNVNPPADSALGHFSPSDALSYSLTQPPRLSRLY